MLAYDVIIIGGGPAGLTAAIYAARARLSTLVLEQAIVGGQIILTSEVENYPGFDEVIGGAELAMKMEKQARRLGVEIQQQIVSSIDLHAKTLSINDTVYSAKALVIATGTQPKKMGIPGEDTLVGRGVSYCAVCDGAFFKGKVVAVIGGGDAAVEESLYLSRLASKVFLIHRRDALRAEKIIQEKAFATSNIEILWSLRPVEIKGARIVEQVILENVKTGEKTELPVNAVFVYIGQQPNTDFLNGQLNLDATGFIVTNEKMETSIPGVYAIGDVRDTVLRQVITAAADGAVAASEIAKGV